MYYFVLIFCLILVPGFGNASNNAASTGVERLGPPPEKLSFVETEKLSFVEKAKIKAKAFANNTTTLAKSFKDKTEKIANQKASPLQATKDMAKEMGQVTRDFVKKAPADKKTPPVVLGEPPLPPFSEEQVKEYMPKVYSFLAEALKTNTPGLQKAMQLQVFEKEENVLPLAQYLRVNNPKRLIDYHLPNDYRMDALLAQGIAGIVDGSGLN